MNNEAAVPTPPAVTPKKGKLSWVIPVLEVLTVVIYFALVWSALKDFSSGFDLGALFGSVKSAVYFLVFATIVITVLCFIPAFKSKGNIRVAIWNIIWLGLNFYGMLTD